MIEQSFFEQCDVECTSVFLCAGVVVLSLPGQRLPGKQQTALHEFVAQAVAMVEQMHGNAAPLQKKNLAIQATIDLFRAFHLPIPPVSALSTAIEARPFLLFIRLPIRTNAGNASCAGPGAGTAC